MQTLHGIYRSWHVAKTERIRFDYSRFKRSDRKPTASSVYTRRKFGPSSQRHVSAKCATFNFTCELNAFFMFSFVRFFVVCRTETFTDFSVFNAMSSSQKVRHDNKRLLRPKKYLCLRLQRRNKLRTGRKLFFLRIIFV